MNNNTEKPIFLNISPEAQLLSHLFGTFEEIDSGENEPYQIRSILDNTLYTQGDSRDICFFLNELWKRILRDDDYDNEKYNSGSDSCIIIKSEDAEAFIRSDNKRSFAVKSLDNGVDKVYVISRFVGATSVSSSIAFTDDRFSEEQKSNPLSRTEKANTTPADIFVSYASATTATTKISSVFTEGCIHSAGVVAKKAYRHELRERLSRIRSCGDEAEAWIISSMTGQVFDFKRDIITGEKKLPRLEYFLKNYDATVPLDKFVIRLNKDAMVKRYRFFLRNP